MKDWIKIKTYEKLYQAEIRKQILEQNDIEVIIINEKDSLFLMGELELYVKSKDKSQAQAILDAFEGIVKVNSFFMGKPVIRFQEILRNNGIDAFLRKKEDADFIFDNYELFVTTDDFEKVIPFLTGEKLIGWKKIDSITRTRQTRFRIELLEEKEIETLIIKKRNTDFHVEEINIYVQDKDLEKANSILSDLNGWIKIDSYNKLHIAEIREDLLGKNEIRAIIKNEDNKFLLYVEAHNEEAAIDTINKQREWTKIGTFTNEIEGNYYKNELEMNEVDATLVSRQDSTFAYGNYDLYVDNFKIEKAIEILKQLEEIEDTNEQTETE